METKTSGYYSWSIANWETPLSRAESLRLETLVDSQQLVITMQDIQEERRPRFCVTFQKYPAYRNINESYRNTLWKLKPGEIGWTFVVENSDWIRELKADPVFETQFPAATHYVICTEDDVIEVISSTPPTISELPMANLHDPIPGKSDIYFK